MNFAEHLMSLRKQRNWTQEELGSQIGVSRQTVSKWEMGQTTPELEKLVELSKLFHISLDQLVGLEPEGESGAFSKVPEPSSGAWSYGTVYEYVSPVKVFGLPLVHIHYGLWPQLAKGVLAVGNCAVGGIAIGGVSAGVISLGGVSIGLLFSLGGIGLGLFALGGLAVGGFAVGGCAVGQWLAMGGGALSNYLAVGGGAASSGLAIGGSAFGHIAVGQEEAEGVFAFLRGQGHHMEEVWTLIQREFPHMWGWVKNLIQWALD